VSVGSSNPGANGIEFIGSNIAGIMNVTVVDESALAHDSGSRIDDYASLSATASALHGLSMNTAWPGPLLVRRVTIIGF